MVRFAVEDDIPAIIRMLYEIRDESEAYSKLTADEEYIAKNIVNILATPGAIFLVDDAGNGLICGGVTAHWHSPDITGVEQMLYVRKNKRGSPLGFRLIKEFERVCIELGATTVQLGLTTGLHVDSTTRLYNRLGYKPHGTTFSKDTSHG